MNKEKMEDSNIDGVTAERIKNIFYDNTFNMTQLFTEKFYELETKRCYKVALPQSYIDFLNVTLYDVGRIKNVYNYIVSKIPNKKLDISDVVDLTRLARVLLITASYPYVRRVSNYLTSGTVNGESWDVSNSEYSYKFECTVYISKNNYCEPDRVLYCDVGDISEWFNAKVIGLSRLENEPLISYLQRCTSVLVRDDYDVRDDSGDVNIDNVYEFRYGLSKIIKSCGVKDVVLYDSHTGKHHYLVTENYPVPLL